MTSPAKTPRQASPDQRPALRATAAELRAAPLPWYGLDAGWRGPRRPGLIATGPDGVVEYGALAHGDPPAGRPDRDPQRRAVSVITMAHLPRRPLTRPDATPAGFLEATTVATAAAVAGMALVDEQWPWHVDASVRDDWMDQQRELAVTVADRLGAEPWRPLTLHVDGTPQAFHYRESAYGWVLATSLTQCLLAAYGRGVSAYSLAFARADLDAYAS